MDKKKIAIISALSYFLFVFTSSMLGIFYLTLYPFTIFLLGIVFLCSIFLSVKVIKNCENSLFFFLLHGIISIFGFILFQYMLLNIIEGSPFPAMAIGSIVYFLLVSSLYLIYKLLKRTKFDSPFFIYSISFVLFILATIIQRVFFLALLFP